jgi:glycosyltransferase involved in cell wall biosynthesis
MRWPEGVVSGTHIGGHLAELSQELKSDRQGGNSSSTDMSDKVQSHPSRREERGVDAPSAGASPTRRVLLVAYDFPPRRTSGVYRPTAFTKYLPQHGWQPTVLTINSPANAVLDQGLLKRVPNSVRVERTGEIRLDWWEAGALQAVRSAGGLQPATPTQSDGVAPGHGLVNNALRRAARLLRSFLYFPDETAGWIPFALARAMRLHLKQNFDVVYTTHPPRSAHPVGLLLSTMFRVPWVMEFRDPWTIPAEEASTIHWRPAARRNALLHQFMTRKASAVVTVTQRHADELRNHFGVDSKKLEMIPNGFDEDDFQGLTPDGDEVFDPAFINLAHFGTVYPTFSGQFFQAAVALFERHPEFKNKVRLHVIGYPDSVVEEMTRHETLKHVLVLHKFVPHNRVLRVMAAADGLLLFYGHEYTSRASIPGKLYEYLRVGRTVFAVAFPGGVQDLIERSQAGWVFRPDDVEGMTAALAQLIRSRLDGHDPVAPDASVVSGFRYDRLSQRLAEVFNRVARV